MNKKEFDILLERYLDGSLSDEQKEILMQTLNDHEWAQENFVNRMTLCADLKYRLECENPVVQTMPKTKAAPDILKKKWRTPLFLFTVTILICFIVGILVIKPWEPTLSMNVVLAGKTNLEVYSGEAPPFNKEIRLTEGYMHFKLYQDAQETASVTIESPAILSIKDAKTIYLKQGTLLADVTGPQQSLTVLTPDLNVQDIGTRFAVQTSLDGSSEVHVFKGKTQLTILAENSQQTVSFIDAGMKGQVNKGVIEKAETNEQAFSTFLFQSADKVKHQTLYPSYDLSINKEHIVNLSKVLYTGEQNRAFIQFDLSTINQQPELLRNAKLRLMLNDTGINNFSVVSMVNDQWNQQSPPAYFSSISPLNNKLSASRKILGKNEFQAPKTGLYYMVDVTDAVIKWLRSPENNHGFCISEAGTRINKEYTLDKRFYSSSRSEHQPQLILNWNKIFTPDPSKKYYIDCPATGGRLCADGTKAEGIIGSFKETVEIPKGVDQSVSDSSVEWMFIPIDDRWYIQRANGGDNPRLRGVKLPNVGGVAMTDTQSIGGWTQFEFTNAGDGKFFITAPDGPESFRRLGFGNDGKIKMSRASENALNYQLVFKEVISKE